MRKDIISIVEDNMTELIYQKLKNTDLAKNALTKYPHHKNNIESFAKLLAKGGMDGMIGDAVDFLFNKKGNIPGFKEATQRALEKALLMCFKDFIYSI